MKTSHWITPTKHATAKPPEQSSFEYIIIGGGYTGLSAAATLAEAGKEVAVMEQQYCGYGASGRNAGHLTPTIGKDIPTLLMLYGKQRTQQLLNLAERAVDYTEDSIQANGNPCAYIPSGNLMAAVSQQQLRQLQKAYKKTRQLDVAMQWLTTADMRQRSIPEAFLGGILEEKGGGLHPGKYLELLKANALQHGVTLMEYTPVKHLEQVDGQYVLHTPTGKLQAPKVLLATNAFQPLHPYLKRKSVPISVSLIETAPLSSEQLAALGWPGKEGIYTAHEMLESYRLTAQNTIVAGSKTVTYHKGYNNIGTAGAHDLAKVKRAFYQRFPVLEGTGIQAEWSGPISFTLDFLPIIRQLNTNLVTAAAYAGHGIAMATYGGFLSAQLLMDKPQQHYLIDRKVVSLPPEPLRGAVARSLIGLLGWMDQRTDKRIARK